MTAPFGDSATPRYSFVIPTYRRPDMLADCLASVCLLDYPHGRIEAVVVDNGGAANSRAAAEPYRDRVHISYLVNRQNRGYGYSVNRGIVAARGEVIALLNDDARPAPDVLRRCDALLQSDPSIGAVGCRAIEAGYESWGTSIGVISTEGHVIGNFDRDCGMPIDVEHLYGFCYFFTRRSLELTGLNDRTLLAKPYSSGNRIETDHCLMIRRAGLRVVYDPRMTAIHLAKPRPDMSEASLAWHRNGIRNTLYLFLKHFGVFGKRGAALRLTFLAPLGLRSALLRPSRANLAYLVNAIGARASAYAHYALYLAGWVSDRPEAQRAVLASDEDPSDGEQVG